MTELIPLEAITPLQVFSDGGLDPIVEKIEKEARSFVLDISTEKGRKEIASLAYKVAQSKTALDKMGKDLVSGWKEQSKKVDQERARVWDRLEALQKEIRSPLTEWENREKDRVANHEAAIAEIGALALFPEEPSAAEIERRIARSVELSGSRSWEEFAQRAKLMHDQTYDTLLKKLETRKQYEAQQVELERLRKLEAERLQKEREERIAQEAAAKAKAEALEAARLEAERLEEQRLALLREKEAAEQRAEKLEQERKALEEQAERDRLAAIEKAEAAKLVAARLERERIEAEKKAEEAAAAKREANKRHCAKINREALAALVAAGLSEEHAKAAVEAIAKGQVPHIRIQY